MQEIDRLRALLSVTEHTRDEYLAQRNSAYQRNYDLTVALEQVDPNQLPNVKPEIWLKAREAMKQVQLAQGIGGYKHPTDHSWMGL